MCDDAWFRTSCSEETGSGRSVGHKSGPDRCWSVGTVVTLMRTTRGGVTPLSGVQTPLPQQRGHERGLIIRREVRAAKQSVGPQAQLVKRVPNPAQPQFDESDGLSNKAFINRDYRKLYANLPRLKTSSVTMESSDERPQSAADAGADRTAVSSELIERARRRYVQSQAERHIRSSSPSSPALLLTVHAFPPCSSFAAPDFSEKAKEPDVDLTRLKDIQKAGARDYSVKYTDRSRKVRARLPA